MRPFFEPFRFVAEIWLPEQERAAGSWLTWPSCSSGAGRRSELLPACRFGRHLGAGRRVSSRPFFADALAAGASAPPPVSTISTPKIAPRSPPVITRLLDEGFFSQQATPSPCFRHQFARIHPAQREEQLGALRRAARRRRRARPRRACTWPPSPGRCTKLDLRGRREQALRPGGRCAPSRPWRSVPAAVRPANRCRPRSRRRSPSSAAGETGAMAIRPVELRAADHRRDLAARDLQVDHRAVADVGAAARQAVRVVAVALEVVAPGLAPEGAGDGAALDDHGRDRLSLLLPASPSRAPPAAGARPPRRRVAIA